MKRNQLIQHWKKWMNRNRSFSKPEMEELESHLWEEMDVMVASEGCSEEEAFAKAVVNMGSSDHVYPEFEKNQPFSIRTRNLIISKSIPIIMTLLLIIAFLIGDSLFSQYHTIEVYNPITGPEIVNMYEVGTTPPILFSNYLSQTKTDLEKPLEKLFFFNINESDSSVYYNRFFWFSKDNSSIDSHPYFAGKTSSLLFVMDDNNNLWIDEDEEIDNYSSFFDDIQPRKVREIKGTTNKNYKYSSITRAGFIKDKYNNTKAYTYRIDDEFLMNSSQFSFEPALFALMSPVIRIDEKWLSDHPNMQFSDEFFSIEFKEDKWFYNVSKVQENNASSMIIILDTYNKNYPTSSKILKIVYFNDIKTKKPFLTIQEVKKDHAPLHIIPFLKEKLDLLISSLIKKNTTGTVPVVRRYVPGVF